MGNACLVIVTPDNPSFKFSFLAQRVEVLQKIMQNVDLPELLGPAIMLVKGCFKLSHLYITDICHLPSYLYLRAAWQYNRTEPTFDHVIAFS